MKPWELAELIEPVEDEDVFDSTERIKTMGNTIGQPLDVSKGLEFSARAMPGRAGIESVVRLTGGLEVESASGGEDAKTVAAIYAPLAQAANEFDAAVAVASSDDYLTESGKREAAKEAGTKLLTTLATVEAQAEALREDIAGRDRGFGEAGWVERPPEVPEVAWESRLSDLRKQISKLDALKRETLYRDAISEATEHVVAGNASHADYAMIAAFETAPPVLDEAGGSARLVPFVSHDLVWEQRVARGRAKHPEAAAERDRLERLANTRDHAAALVRSELLKRVPELDGRAPEVLSR